MMNENLQIDSLDKKILTMITKNARIPFLEVARACNVSGAAIHQRVQRLINSGIISGSQFTVNPEKIGFHTCAFVGIYLEKASYHKDVIKELSQIPEIVECHYTTGGYAVFIKVYTRNNDHLRNILGDRLQSIQGILRTETFISLDENFKRQIPLE